MKAGTTASGVFVGRSGKPMAKVRLALGEVARDDQVLYSKIKLPPAVPIAVTDANGQFQFRDFVPGAYTIVYQLPGATSLLPAEISIRSLAAETRSLVPLLRDMEIGKTGEPYRNRPWGANFILMQGHTFYLLPGASMKPWNATARWRQNAHVEIRRGLIWMEKFADKGQIKLEAWSF
ncbi:MAG: carboxypeptidase regulatory-like domain-containing protein [Armatimonadetes bacterium]|nr:carboxypeptidase regulatory-like domain-containing protein [Armatimonadota bacterium]